MSLTYAELFAGGGGLSLGLEIAGWTPVAHAEIEPHARAVLRRHWPHCRLDGDVAEIRGADYRGATLLSGGSPCQDLSIAGKRAGMTEGSGTRSSLFFEQVRIRDEAEIPYFLWENVLGALSSNTGRDFAAVLSALVGAAIPVPRDGWESAGVAAGPTGVAAWRVLDCQFFGPPQRRRRVFVLGARAGGVDPAEVLALAEGVRGDSPARGEAWEAAPADVGGGAHFAFNWQVAGKHGAVNLKDRSDSLHVGQTPAVMSFNPSHFTRDKDGAPSEIAAPLSADADRGDQEQVVVLGVYPTLRSHQRNNSNPTTEASAIVLRNREGKPGGGKGPLLSEERSLTLASANDQVLFTRPVVAPTFSGGAHPGGANGQDAAQIADSIMQASGVGVPRRLMPIECERLMGWPDGHTATGVDEDGQPYTISDSARYRIIGNGVASPVAGWIAWRLRWALERA